MRIMVKSAWWDIDKKGRDIQAVIEQCKTKYYQAEKEGKTETAEAYFKRWSICNKLIQPYVQEVTGIRKILNQNDRRSDIPKLSQ